MVIVEPEGRAARHQRTSWLSSVPLLAFVVIAYVAFAAGGADFVLTRFTVAMPSGGSWQISLGDMMLAFSLFVLFFEILKSTRTGGNSQTATGYVFRADYVTANGRPLLDAQGRVSPVMTTVLPVLFGPTSTVGSITRPSSSVIERPR